MQGQRGTVQSLSESFEFDLASSSNNSTLDPQLYWNNVLNPVTTHSMQDFLPSSGVASTTFASAVGHDGGSFAGWNPGGSSSSQHALNQTSHSESRVDQGWASSVTNHSRANARLEERGFEPTDLLTLESVNIDLNNSQVTNGPLLQNSGPDDAPQNAHLPAGFIATGGHAVDAGVFPHPYKPGGSETGQLPSASGSVNPGATSGAAEHPIDDADGRPGCSLDSRRSSCKRKAFEGVSGPSSIGGSSNCFQRAESSAWHAVPSRQNNGSNLSISNPAEHLSCGSSQESLLNPRLGGIRVAPDCHTTSTGDGSGESSQRNFRMRINPTPSPNLWSPGSTSRRSHVLPSHQSSSRLLLFNQPIDSRPPAANVAPPQTQPIVPHVAGFPRNVSPLPWNGAPNSRAGGSSSSSGLREEANSRSISRSVSEQLPMFVPSPEIRQLNQEPTNWNLSNGSMSIPGSSSMPGNASSRIGSSSGAHASLAPTWMPQHPQHPTWVPQHPHTRHSRRLSDVRRSLFSSVGSDSGASSSSFPPRTVPSSQEVLPSGSGHQPSYLRSGFWMDRQGDGVLGVPLSLRALASASEGRSRLATEICNVLELVRRGENFRFEDVLILDQSVIFGVPDLHDRHRDMRLDVDNMSYEELLALEERIGNVSTGLSEETVLKCLKQRKYACMAMETAASEVEPCCICQEEYVDGEDVGTLECGHDFHTGCIKQWLMHKNLCPICKTTALVT